MVHLSSKSSFPEKKNLLNLLLFPHVKHKQLLFVWFLRGFAAQLIESNKVVRGLATELYYSL